ncbi:hypothetical protein D1BOALGB6SA_252 [Olavius sp. associated proteobacterium Delta 1]|nr:hypothetical protein D1BOALGB6SA_252 [Olavius sp. associated proteobacterium Delta 1]
METGRVTFSDSALAPPILAGRDPIFFHRLPFLYNCLANMDNYCFYVNSHVANENQTEKRLIC